MLLDKFKKINIKDKSNVWNTEVVEALELENLYFNRGGIESALNRKRKSGCVRVDYKKRNDKSWFPNGLDKQKQETKIRYR